MYCAYSIGSHVVAAVAALNVVHVITGAVRSNFGASALAGSVLPAGSRCLLSVRRCVCARLGESASQVRGAAALHQRKRDIVAARRRDGCDRLRAHGRGGCAERRAGVGGRCGRQRKVLSHGWTVHADEHVGEADLAEARPPLARLDGASKWEPVCVGRIDRRCNWDCGGRSARRWRVGQRAEGHDHVPPSRMALKFASSTSSGSLPVDSIDCAEWIEYLGHVRAVSYMPNRLREPSVVAHDTLFWKAC